MKKVEVQLTADFKRQTIRVALAIVFFILTYFFILTLAVLLTALCIAGGIAIIAVKPMLATLVLGAGVASLGVLVLIFLLKFIFKSHKVDRSHLIEINRQLEPELFKMIEEIVETVGTRFPKRVYLSSDVNAAVFYDSSFWSMFLPIKKNLQIGLGLINTVTKEELRAILSHEFGHFSQKTMKVGSYVYNVNQVIFNLLFDNQSYENIAQRWANVNSFFSFFVDIAVKINSGIQWVLRKMYGVVNKNYMALSREMEFHADEIAASVAGFEPLKMSLLRMALADNSFNDVLNFYNNKIAQNLKSENLYKDHLEALQVLAEINSLSIKNGFPNVVLEEKSRFDKSKLVVKDQWASHPTLEERIERVERTGFTNNSDNAAPANTVFIDINKWQRLMTAKMFESVTYQGDVTVIASDGFKGEYRKGIRENSFSKIYNGYYDYKNPVGFDLNQKQFSQENISFNDLFSDEKVDLVYTSLALQRDIETLKNIINDSSLAKTFDYDGVRYKNKDAGVLIETLKKELENVNESIKKNDSCIYEYFKRIESKQNSKMELELLYSSFIQFDKSFDTKYELYIKLSNELNFVGVVTPYDQIRENLKDIEPVENSLKQEISILLADNLLFTELNPDMKDNLQKYVSRAWEYFNGTSYMDDNLNMLYAAMQNFAFLLSRKYFLMKKALLVYQETLLQEQR